MLGADDFREQLYALFREAERRGLQIVWVRAGDLHYVVGDYPGPDHRMPVCCQVMRGEMRPGDTVVDDPPSGQGASLTVKYLLPRQ